MQIIVEYEGKTYKSVRDDDACAHEIAAEFSKNWGEVTKLKINLEGGGCLLMGNIAVQSAVVKFIP